jgi:hypothetical protein
LEQVRDELEAIHPMPAVFDQRYVKHRTRPAYCSLIAVEWVTARSGQEPCPHG